MPELEEAVRLRQEAEGTKNGAFVTVSLAHAPVLAELHRRCFEVAAEGAEAVPGEVWGGSAWRSILAMPGAQGEILLEDGVPIGFYMILVAVDGAEILALGMLPAFRRRKLGRCLLRRLVAACIRLRVLKITLEVAADNGPAVALYTANGFKTLGRRREYYRRGDGSSVDALLLGRSVMPDC